MCFQKSKVISLTEWICTFVILIPYIPGSEASNLDAGTGVAKHLYICIAILYIMIYIYTFIMQVQTPRLRP